MFTHDQNLDKFFSRKAYELGYALFRISETISRKMFAEALERQSISLLETVSRGEYAKTRTSVKSLEYLLGFGGDLGLLHTRNAEAVLAELKAFDTVLAEYERSAKEKQEEPAVSLEGIFSAQIPAMVGSERGNQVAEKREHAAPRRQEQEAMVLANGGVQENGNGGGVVKAAMRQSAILERIRQNGNCRLKDVQEFLPDASERTIRYDIQNLIEKGLVERLGNGGPATFYRLKN